MTAMDRRRFGFLAAASLFAPGAFAQAPAVPIADMHSHLHMFGRKAGFDMRRQLVDTGTKLLAWAIVDDSRWIRGTSGGIVQVAHPKPGELWSTFQDSVRQYDSALSHWKVAKVLTAADVDAAIAGDPRVVMASESANFLEGDPSRVAQAHAMGLRHLQMVHYIETLLGDLQTAEPRHNAAPDVALKVMAECRRLGIVVDVAHSTPPLVDAALDSGAAVVWSHSWVTRRAGTWRDYGYLARALSPEQAKKIAAKGGVIGLWVLRVRDSAYPVYSIGSYADEVVRMVDLLGPEAVAFGTDMEGVGANPVMSDYTGLREVVDALAKRGLPEQTLRNVCYGNYARVLKKAMGV